MSKRDDAIARYAQDMTAKLGMTPNMDLLTKVVIGLGPSIYNPDSETVAGSDPAERDRVKHNYLIKKLGLSDGPELDDAITAVMARYGTSNRNKYRAVVYYLLCEHFGKQSVYA